MVEVATRRLLLRPFASSDEEAVLAYRNDPAVARYQGWPLPYSAAHFQSLLDPARRLADTGWTSWCITDGTVCGDIGLRGHDRQAEVGISLATPAQRQGYAREALTGLTEYAFGRLDLHRLHAGVDPANEAVIRLLTGLGWRHEGTCVQSYRHRDGWTDEATYALLAAQWRAPAI